MSPCTEGRTRRRLSLCAALLLLSVALQGCGGGGGGGSNESPPLPSPSPAPAPASAPSASPLQTQAVYQPGVKTLADSLLPQLDVAGPGSLSLTQPSGVKVGDVFLSQGRAYVATAVSADGRTLQTRAPAMDEVFQTLRISGTLDSSLLKPAQTDRRQALAASPNLGALSLVTGTIGFAQDLPAYGPVQVKLNGQLQLSVTLDLDYSAASGLNKLDFKVSGNLEEGIKLNLDPAGGAQGQSGDITLTKLSWPVPQAWGALRIDVPLVLSMKAQVGNKLSADFLSGGTSFEFSSHWDPASKTFSHQSSSNSAATASAPVLSGATQAATSSVTVALGPELRLVLLDSVTPLTASARMAGTLAAQTQTVVASGLSCLSWSADLAAQLTAEFKLSNGIKMEGQYTPYTKRLAAGGDLSPCMAATPAPPPAPQPPSPPASSPDGATSPSASELAALLPIPANALPLSGYVLSAHIDSNPQGYLNYQPCSSGRLVDGSSYSYCLRYLMINLSETGSSSVLSSAAATRLYDQFEMADKGYSDLSTAESICRVKAPELPGVQAQFHQGDILLMNIAGLGPQEIPGLAFGQGTSNLGSTGPLSLVCNHVLVDRLSAQRYYLRLEYLHPTPVLRLTNPANSIFNTYWFNLKN
nr:hypothetical protein [uncultured Roseateles sp.]